MKNSIDLKDLEKAKTEYLKDNGRGVIILDFKDLIDKYDDFKDILLNQLLNIEPDIYKKSSFIQKVLINRILLSNLLEYRNSNDINVNIEISSCDIMLPDNNWLGRIKELILPTISKNYE